MAITRRGGGISGKECAACKQWKPFAEYTMIKKPGGNMKIAPLLCTQCADLAKAEEKKAKYKKSS